MQTTDISWCDYTWSPVTGCSHAGPECWNCWAETFMQRQAQRDDAPAYMTDDDWTQENAEAVVTIHEDRLDEPLTFSYPDGPGRIFVVSMGDLLEDATPLDGLDWDYDQDWEQNQERLGKTVDAQLDGFESSAGGESA